MHPSLVTQMINNIITTNPNIITNPYNYVNQKYINKKLSYSGKDSGEGDSDDGDGEGDGDGDEELDLDKAVIYKIDKEKFINELSVAISNHIYEQLAKIIDSHNNSILEKYNKIIQKYDIKY